MRAIEISNTTINVENVVSISADVRSKRGSMLYSAYIVINGNIDIVIARNLSHDVACKIASDKYETLCGLFRGDREYD